MRRARAARAPEGHKSCATSCAASCATSCATSFTWPSFTRVAQGQHGGWQTYVGRGFRRWEMTRTSHDEHLYAPVRSSNPHPLAPPPLDPRLKPGPVFGCSSLPGVLKRAGPSVGRNLELSSHKSRHRGPMTKPETPANRNAVGKISGAAPHPSLPGRASFSSYGEQRQAFRFRVQGALAAVGAHRTVAHTAQEGPVLNGVALAAGAKVTQSISHLCAM